MRGISFMLTTRQVRDRTKRVTRRVGWKNLKAGDKLLACVKCMGLEKGERREVICTIVVTAVTREALCRIADYPNDCALEGFPELAPEEFVSMFCKHHRGCLPHTIITRIEFDYVDDATTTAVPNVQKQPPRSRQRRPELLVRELQDGVRQRPRRRRHIR